MSLVRWKSKRTMQSHRKTGIEMLLCALKCLPLLQKFLQNIRGQIISNNVLWNIVICYLIRELNNELSFSHLHWQLAELKEH